LAENLSWTTVTHVVIERVTVVGHLQTTVVAPYRA
jgi:hypothetical protein